MPASGYSLSMDDAHLLDLHSELQSDVSGARRADLLARLRGLRDNCLAAKRELCDRDAFSRLEAAGVAVTAAIRIVQNLPRQRDGN
jgi:hypothetical protein